MNLRRRVAALSVAAIAVSGLATVITADAAQAHGAAMKPGARTYLCWKDGLNPVTGAIQPNNPACAAAVGQSGPNSLYNWFAVLRSDAAGRRDGFVPDGKLCSAAAVVYDFAGFDLARSDWPVTHLTAGASFDFWYSNWAHHPGTFYFWVTKDSWSPTRALAWSDLESSPFLTVTNPPNNGGPGTNDGYYYWNGRLPSGKSGRHIIYSQWVRSDSNENFYGCSDVVFDGGTGAVTGVGPGTGGTTTTTTTTTTRPTTTTTTTRPTTTTTRPTTTTTRPTTTTTTRGGITTTAGLTTTTSGGGGSGGCTAAFSIASSWGSGFVADVKVTAGSSSMSGWRVTLNLPSGAAISNIWSGVNTGTSGTVQVANANYNGQVSAGGTTSFGFQGTGSPSGTTVSCTPA